jgi:putative ATP-dependent endonuclease of OLD family
MRIVHVKVFNYRNIDGISVEFNQDCSYLIGENNLGKSNLLSLLDTVCNGRGFDDKDFFDHSLPIVVELKVKLLSSEQGFFGDNFSPDDSSVLQVRYQQTNRDPFPNIVNAETNESISPRLIKKINFLKYETTAVPSRELRLDTQRGAGLLVNSIIDRYITGGEEAPVFLNEETIGGLATFINDHLKKIRSFREYSIRATVAPNPTEMLTDLFYLSDGDRKLDTTGSGVQFIAMASINILSQIMDLYKSKSMPFEEQLYTDSTGKKLLPLIIAIDEPEVHLHPYLQRSLIGYYKRILCNEDIEFIELLMLCFGIDGIDGQLIIVTHSTDALIGDYRNLMRFYKDGRNTSVVSGADQTLQIDRAKEKHLIMHFPEIKEAFYSHCAILIEGETEYGCIHAFADKLSVSLDDFGICIINARGEGSILPLRRLLEVFAIPSIAIYDSDLKAGQTPSDGEYYTQKPCFEIEIVKAIFDSGYKYLAKQIALDIDGRAESQIMDANFVKKAFEKMDVDIESYTPKKLSDVDENDENDFVQMYSAWFMQKKGVLLGRVIGNTLPSDIIPDCYKNAIMKAREVAENA